MARWLRIVSKHRRMRGMHASLADFTVERTEVADASLIATRTELSLYCLDHESRAAIFAELPADRRLADASFLYMEQYDQATRLLSVPYPEFLRVADGLRNVGRFVMIYMTGRSGSTLLSHALNEVQGVVSLSEPDAPVGLVHLQRAGATSAAELRALLRASVRLLFRREDGSLPDVCALKMRSESIQLVDLMQATYPHGISLFLYRDAVGWIGSMYRILRRLGNSERLPVEVATDDFDRQFGIDAGPLLPLLGRDAREIDLIEFLTLWWIAIIEQYLEATGRGFQATAFRYEDISRRPERSLPRILGVCKLSPAEVKHAMKAYGTDSQAGTPLSQASAGEDRLTLTPRQTGLIESIVSRHPVIHDPWIEVPGTERFS